MAPVHHRSYITSYQDIHLLKQILGTIKKNLRDVKLSNLTRIISQISDLSIILFSKLYRLYELYMSVSLIRKGCSMFM
jgi:hypothetical protein